MAVFVSDTFVDTDAVTLNNHTETPTAGSGWSADASSLEIDTNQVKASAGTSSSIFFAINDTAPASNEYDVEVDVDWTATTTNHIGCMGRWSSAKTGYLGRIYDGTMALYKMTTGSYSLLDSDGGHGTGPLTVKLEIRDATKKVYVDDVEVCTSTNDDHTQTGYAGVSIRGIASGADFRLDNFVATDVEAGGGATQSMHKRFGGTPGANLTGRGYW